MCWLTAGRRARAGARGRRRAAGPRQPAALLRVGGRGRCQDRALCTRGPQAGQPTRGERDGATVEKDVSGGRDIQRVEREIAGERESWEGDRDREKVGTIVIERELRGRER